jgi:hypothetical protein
MRGGGADPNGSGQGGFAAQEDTRALAGANRCTDRYA